MALLSLFSQLSLFFRSLKPYMPSLGTPWRTFCRASPTSTTCTWAQRVVLNRLSGKNLKVPSKVSFIVQFCIRQLLKQIVLTIGLWDLSFLVCRVSVSPHVSRPQSINAVVMFSAHRYCRVSLISSPADLLLTWVFALSVFWVEHN